MCIISDGPLEVGCFILTSDHNSVHQAVAALTHEECVVKCHDDGMRIAAISNVLAKQLLYISCTLFTFHSTGRRLLLLCRYWD